MHVAVLPRSALFPTAGLVLVFICCGQKLSAKVTLVWLLVLLLPRLDGFAPLDLTMLILLSLSVLLWLLLPFLGLFPFDVLVCFAVEAA